MGFQLIDWWLFMIDWLVRVLSVTAAVYKFFSQIELRKIAGQLLVAKNRVELFK